MWQVDNYSLSLLKRFGVNMAKQKQRPSQEIVVDEAQLPQLEHGSSNALKQEELPRSKKGTAEGLAMPTGSACQV